MNTLIFIDWDDTLFPTSWIVRNNIDVLDDKTVNQYIVFFSKLDTILYELLSEIKKYGKIVIVTNAVNKWVYNSSNMLPNSKNFIKKNVIVISARDIYQKTYPNNMDIWKLLIFENIANKNLNDKKQNIISIGDAEYEFNALKKLHNNSRILKSIRFMKNPTFDELLDQLGVFKNNIHKILTSNKYMDLKFQIK